MRWHWINFGYLALPHACPAELVEHVVRDIEGRRDDIQIESDEEIESFFMDMPGMVCMDRPISSHMLGDVLIEIPDEDVASILTLLEELPLRHFVEPATGNREVPRSIPYYKLKVFYRAVVLTPTDRLQLLSVLRDALPAAEASATAFYAERKTPGEVLREANAKVHGVPVEKMPDCGGHERDRFKTKTRGQA